MVETGKVLYIKFLYSIRTSTRFIDYLKGITYGSPIFKAVQQKQCKAGAAFSWGRGGIATQMRYACGIPRQGFQRRRITDAMPQRQHTP